MLAQRASSDGIVKRNRNRDGRALCPLLHDAVTAALADREETMLFENLADLQARKNLKPTQPGPRPESQARHRGTAASPRTGPLFRKTASVLRPGSPGPLR